MLIKEFTGGAPKVALSTSISASDLSFAVPSGEGYPTGLSAPFVVALERGTASEEKVLCTSRSDNVFSIDPDGRGYDGTSAFAHPAGASVEHVLDAQTLTDLTEQLTGGYFASTVEDETIEGTFTFEQPPIVPVVATVLTPNEGGIWIYDITDTLPDTPVKVHIRLGSSTDSFILASDVSTAASGGGFNANKVVRRDGWQINVPLEPTADQHASSKKYVDDAIDGVVDAANAAKIAVGTYVGSGTPALRKIALPFDTAQVTVTCRADAEAGQNARIAMMPTGDAVVGPTNLPALTGTPGDPLEVTTTSSVRLAAGGFYVSGLAANGLNTEGVTYYYTAIGY